MTRCRAKLPPLTYMDVGNPDKGFVFNANVERVSRGWPDGHSLFFTRKKSKQKKRVTHRRLIASCSSESYLGRWKEPDVYGRFSRKVVSTFRFAHSKRSLFLKDVLKSPSAFFKKMIIQRCGLEATRQWAPNLLEAQGAYLGVNGRTLRHVYVPLGYLPAFICC